MVDSSPGLTRLVECGLRDLRVEPQRHQIVQRLDQFARELGVERADLREPCDARRRARLVQSFFQRQRPHAVHDRKDAALLEIERVALRLRGHEIVEEADRRRKGFDRAGEPRKMHPLAVHEIDQILLGRAQQLSVAGRRLRVVEDCDVHRRRFRRRARASGGSRRDSRRASSTRRDCAPSPRPDRAESRIARARRTRRRGTSRDRLLGPGSDRMSPLSWSVRKVCSPRPSLPITMRQPNSRMDLGATSAKSLACRWRLRSETISQTTSILTPWRRRVLICGSILRAARARSPTEAERSMRPATSCELPARKLRRSMSSRTPTKSPFAVTATRRLLCLVILRSAVETRSSGSTLTTGRCASGADRTFDRSAVEDRRVQEVGAGDDADPLARERTAHRTCFAA